jgi:hypothetical protein
MYSHQFTEESINDIILKYSDETFGVRDAVSFEMLLKFKPEYLEDARINRKIRLDLKSLPKLKATPGFEARLAARIEREC